MAHRAAPVDDYVEKLLASRVKRQVEASSSARPRASNTYSAAWSPVPRRPAWSTSAAAASASRASYGSAAAAEPESPGAAWAERVRRRHQEDAFSSTVPSPAPRAPSTLRDALEAKRAELAQARASLQGRSESAMRRAQLRTPSASRAERARSPPGALLDAAADAAAARRTARRDDVAAHGGAADDGGRWAQRRAHSPSWERELEPALAQLEVRNASLESQLAHAHRQLDDARRPAAGVQELRWELQRAQDERRDAQRRARALDAELSALASEKAALEADALDFKNRMEGAVSTFEQIVEEAVVEKSALQQEISTLRAQLREANEAAEAAERRASSASAWRASITADEPHGAATAGALSLIHI